MCSEFKLGRCLTSDSALDMIGQNVFPQSMRLPRHCMQIVEEEVVTKVRESMFLAGSKPVRF